MVMDKTENHNKVLVTLLGIITAGLLMSGEIVAREMDGELNLHLNQLTRDNY